MPLHSPAGPRWRLRPSATLLLIALGSLRAQAEEELPLMIVEGERPVAGYLLETETPATVHTLDARAIERFGAKGSSNPYAMVWTLPGVQAPSIDAWGLVNQQGGNKGLRVRGERTTHGANGTVEGIPLNGPGAGPGYLFLLDAENIASVSLAQGAIAPDRFSLYDTAGQLDTRLLWPKADMGGTVSFGLGSNSFSRRFARFDSGLLPSDTAFFLSGSSTQAEKWRGSGDSPDRKETFAIGLTQALGAVDFKLFVARNEMDADNYRGLTYEQSKDTSLYRRIDYDPSPTGSTAAQWANWQGYNRQSFETTAVLSQIGYRFNDDTHLTIKPFWSEEKGEYLYPNGNFVRQWLIDHSTYGVTTELHTRLAETRLTLGYGWVSMEPPGPPTAWKQYRPDANGGLTFANWALLADVTRRHDLHNLFAVAERNIGRLRVKGGLRYVKDILPSIDYHDSTGVGDLSYEDALEQSPGIVAARSVRRTAIEEVAPYLGLAYPLNDRVEFRFSAGRNLGSPGFDAFQTPVINGLPKQQLWNDSEMEIADSLDMGLRLSLGRGYLEPLLFYTRYDNKGVSLYDPAYGAAYTQNIGKARRFGLTLASGWRLRDDLELFGNLTWLRAEFAEDLRTGANTLLEIRGRQLPDVPSHIATLGATWTRGSLSLSPVAQYMGKRYANVEHTQTMDAYTLVNLNLSYRAPTPWGTAQASLAVINLFDERYIGFNNANETSNGSSFYPGAPRSLLGTLTFEF
ncbi:TonB-dependent receptor domain-containing protein [Stutzerimonas tarimensis]|uniref:TonB-dependent receptor domain-containing protein n=1 Tax=Stutzerimonas tarimensis TaxID=1507735 RepID=A0ABV7T7M9_9GAMM